MDLVVPEYKQQKKIQCNTRFRDKALILAIETLMLYANPESYHAITMFYDRPCGWFADDVGKVDHLHYSRKMHGATARKTLVKITNLLNKYGI